MFDLLMTLSYHGLNGCSKVPNIFRVYCKLQTAPLLQTSASSTRRLCPFGNLGKHEEFYKTSNDHARYVGHSTHPSSSIVARMDVLPAPNEVPLLLNDFYLCGTGGSLYRSGRASISGRPLPAPRVASVPGRLNRSPPTLHLLVLLVKSGGYCKTPNFRSRCMAIVSRR